MTETNEQILKSLTPLNKDNYITNHEYMSYSRFSRFLSCEASAAANYREPSTTARLVGSYVDAYFSNELDDFRLSNPEIFKKDGTLKSEFIQADEIIKRIESDPGFMKLMSGEKQKIFTGVIGGVPFKAKIDSFLEDNIVDLKVMKDFNRVFSEVENRYTNFVEAYNYDMEMAIFQELVRQNIDKTLPVTLACITKETPSDVGAFSISQGHLDEMLELIEKYLPRIKDILDGKVAPRRCEKCSYCRMTKKINDIYDYELVGANGDKLREEGYDCEDPKLENKGE